MRDSRTLNDAKLQILLESIRKGEENAFENLVSLIQRTVLSFGMKVCGHTQDAEDTMQQTLLQAFKSLPKLQIRNAKAFRVWLYKVAKNSCLMMRRRGKYEPERELSLDHLMPSHEGPESLEIPDWSRIPEKELLRTEVRDVIRNAVLDLTVQYRSVLVLRDMEQLSTEEAAEALNLSKGTVKIRLHRARLYVRKRLEDYFVRQKGCPAVD